MDFLSNCGILYGGLLEDESSPVALTVDILGKKFAFISCAVDYCIKDDQMYSFPKIISANWRSLPDILREVSLECDYTVVLVHGGNEMIPYPEPDFRILCQSFVDAGADVVISHHPHVLGGLHQYKGKYIFFSLGDFIFDGESGLRRNGLVLSLIFDDRNISYELHPTVINNNLTVELASYKLKTLIKKKWCNVSDVFLLDSVKYKKQYTYRYVGSFIYFQVDRLVFLLKHKNFSYIISFLLRKSLLVPFYFRRFFFSRN